jgi:hypothetical protein
MKKIILIILVSTLVGLAYWTKTHAPDENASQISQTQDATASTSDAPVTEKEPKFIALARGDALKVGNEAKKVGVVEVLGEKADSPFMLSAVFSKYPNPDTNHYYEGWLVNRKTGNFVSTGRLINKFDDWVNTYTFSGSDSDFDQYVLTLETVGGSDASETHLAEAVLKKTN